MFTNKEIIKKGVILAIKTSLITNYHQHIPNPADVTFAMRAMMGDDGQDN